MSQTWCQAANQDNIEHVHIVVARVNVGVHVVHCVHIRLVVVVVGNVTSITHSGLAIIGFGNISF